MKTVGTAHLLFSNARALCSTRLSRFLGRGLELGASISKGRSATFVLEGGSSNETDLGNSEGRSSTGDKCTGDFLTEVERETEDIDL
jgi:hypothetical protein